MLMLLPDILSKYAVVRATEGGMERGIVESDVVEDWAVSGNMVDGGIDGRVGWVILRR